MWYKTTIRSLFLRLEIYFTTNNLGVFVFMLYCNRRARRKIPFFTIPLCAFALFYYRVTVKIMKEDPP